MNARDAISLPAVVIATDGCVTSARTWDDLTVGVRAALRDGYFTGQLIVDQTGQSWTTTSAREVETVGPFWGRSIFGSVTIRVELDLLVGERYGLERLKERILQSFRQAPHLFEGVGGPQAAWRRIKSAPTFEHLLRCLPQA
jgi:hypothetical protein